MQNETFFFRFGKSIYHFRKLILILWLVIIVATLPFLKEIMTPFRSTGFVDYNSQSVQAEEFLNKYLTYSQNRLLLIYSSPTIRNTNPLFIQKIKTSLLPMKDFPLEYETILPTTSNKQLSQDKHTAYVVILLEKNTPLSQDLLIQLEKRIEAPKGMNLHFGGEAFFVSYVTKQTQHDLYQADSVAAPVSLLILILIFGSVTAALLPLFLGGGSALIILFSLYIIGHFCVLSIFTLNIALLLGLCLSLDYSLFIISRFREELQTKNVSEALAITLQTAGKAIFFSGLAVSASLSALLLFPVTILFSVGIGGLAAVFIAVAVAITLLPAILGMLNQKINTLSLSFFRKKTTSFHFWRKLSTAVIKHPLVYFISVLSILLLLGYPFLQVEFGLSDHRILPPHSEGRKFFDDYKKAFNENELTPLILIVSSKKPILSKSNLNQIIDITDKLNKNPLISRVFSIVTTEPHLSKKAYQQLYQNPHKIKNKELKQLLLTTTRLHFTTITIVSKYKPHSPEIAQLIQELRAMKPGKELSLQITGVPVKNEDVFNTIQQLFPYAVLWIVCLTYVILLFLLRSLFLPLKAILMNMVSLCASYGILVFIFQEGYLHQWLNFEPQGLLDVTLLIIIFCALFGFSMDYEVFLLTRIRESYLRNKSNNQSIVYGIEHSSKLITGAATIVIFICGSFMVADVLMVKAFGLGIAVAIFVDAFLVRSLLVPATMALVESWNWYIPRWLDKILPHDD